MGSHSHLKTPMNDTNWNYFTINYHTLLNLTFQIKRVRLSSPMLIALEKEREGGGGGGGRSNVAKDFLLEFLRTIYVLYTISF